MRIEYGGRRLGGNAEGSVFPALGLDEQAALPRLGHARGQQLGARADVQVAILHEVERLDQPDAQRLEEGPQEFREDNARHAGIADERRDVPAYEQ